MLPFRLTPATRDYLWGGTRLQERYGKESSGDILAETWELSAHPQGSSAIATGQWAGISFAEYIRRFPKAVGKGHSGDFPLLIKLIDAKLDLSVQVHPGDAYAQERERSLGKTEMWVVLEAEPGAFLYCGFEREPGPGELRSRIAANTLTEILHKVVVHPGDVIFIPAGTIHAIGAGILLAEIQENSDITYRVYDFGRRDKDGNLRELHVEKALEVIAPTVGAPKVPGMQSVEETAGKALRRLARCGYFAVWDIRLDGELPCAAGEESFHSLLCVEGKGSLFAGGEELPFHKGDSLFVPAGTGEYRLRGERSHLLLTTLG